MHRCCCSGSSNNSNSHSKRVLQQGSVAGGLGFCCTAWRCWGLGQMTAGSGLRSQLQVGCVCFCDIAGSFLVCGCVCTAVVSCVAEHLHSITHFVHTTNPPHPTASLIECTCCWGIGVNLVFHRCFNNMCIQAGLLCEGEGGGHKNVVLWQCPFKSLCPLRCCQSYNRFLFPNTFCSATFCSLMQQPPPAMPAAPPPPLLPSLHPSNLPSPQTQVTSCQPVPSQT